MKITVITQAYNARNYIEKCIRSIINQTHKDFEYFLIDNGSNDGSEKIMADLARTDNRITLIRHDQNGPARWHAPLYQSNGDFFTMVDADDWLEPDYLEKLSAVAEQTNADIVTTGSVMHIEKTNQETTRAPSRRLVIDKNHLAKEFPVYHVYFRPVWGKLFRMDTVRKTRIPTVEQTGIFYGMDTVTSLAFLRNADVVCIDNSALHHYLVRNTSVSYNYSTSRSDSDLYLYNDAIDFLSAYGPVSEDNMFFINVVYANAITDTLNVIDKSGLSPEEKLKECRKIMERKETQKAYRYDHPHTKKSIGNMLIQALKCCNGMKTENEDFRFVVDTLLPYCGPTVCKDNLALFSFDNVLLNILVTDIRNDYLNHLLELICAKKYTKQFDLGKMVSIIARNNPLLCNISSTKFLRKHSELYKLIWNEKYIDGLHKMTDYLLSSNNPDEIFLQLYLNLSAAMGKVDEFLLGKTKSAVFFFKEKRYDECRSVLDELSEMGVEDTEEIEKIKLALN